MVLPVHTAFMSFTEVPEARRHAYDHWHALDHMPEQFGIGGVVGAQRFVAPPDLLERRVTTDPGLARAQYFHYYLMSRPLDQTLEEFRELAGTLRSLGRWFPDFVGRLNGPFRFVKAYASSGVLVRPEVVPYRPCRGVFLTVQNPVGDVDPATVDHVRQRYDQIYVPRTISLPGVVGCWWFEARGDATTSGLPSGPEGRTVRIYWLESDPAGMLDSLLECQRGPDDDLIADTYATVFMGAYRTNTLDR
jgi:hypothetical protein